MEESDVLFRSSLTKPIRCDSYKTIRAIMDTEMTWCLCLAWWMCVNRR